MEEVCPVTGIWSVWNRAVGGGGGGAYHRGGGGPANRQPGSYMDPYTASERNFEGSLSVRYHIWSQTQWSGM